MPAHWRVRSSRPRAASGRSSPAGSGRTERREILMRAIVVESTGPPDVLRVANVAAREPGPREIRIAVAACGVCFHDVVVRNGTFRRGVGMPVILGHEVAGTIEKLGSEVREFRCGDVVATTTYS